jgi:hypothetical protein
LELENWAEAPHHRTQAAEICAEEVKKLRETRLRKERAADALRLPERHAWLERYGTLNKLERDTLEAWAAVPVERVGKEANCADWVNARRLVRVHELARENSAERREIEALVNEFEETQGNGGWHEPPYDPLLVVRAGRYRVQAERQAVLAMATPEATTKQTEGERVQHMRVLERRRRRLAAQGIAETPEGRAVDERHKRLEQERHLDELLRAALQTKERQNQEEADRKEAQRVQAEEQAAYDAQLAAGMARNSSEANDSQRPWRDPRTRRPRATIPNGAPAGQRPNPIRIVPPPGFISQLNRMDTTPSHVQTAADLVAFKRSGSGQLQETARKADTGAGVA